MLRILLLQISYNVEFDGVIVATLRTELKMIGKGFVLFKINSSPSAFYIIKPTCIVIGF